MHKSNVPPGTGAAAKIGPFYYHREVVTVTIWQLAVWYRFASACVIVAFYILAFSYVNMRHDDSLRFALHRLLSQCRPPPLLRDGSHLRFPTTFQPASYPRSRSSAPLCLVHDHSCCIQLAAKVFVWQNHSSQNHDFGLALHHLTWNCEDDRPTVVHQRNTTTACCWCGDDVCGGDGDCGGGNSGGIAVIMVVIVDMAMVAVAVMMVVMVDMVMVAER